MVKTRYFRISLNVEDIKEMAWICALKLHNKECCGNKNRVLLRENSTVIKMQSKGWRKEAESSKE
jgi:hypothetical protein